MTDGAYSCANCGADLPHRLAHARMVVCEHCGTTSVLEDEAFRLAGTGGVIQDAPSLVHLNEEINAGGSLLMPVGHAQFSYGRGWWDEFWCVDDEGDGCWLSVDEGDYAIEIPLPADRTPKGFRPRLGEGVEINGESYVVTEAETATCAAVRGEFPEALTVGESHLYFDLSGRDGRLATFERWDGGEAWTFGRWIDPWEVKAP